MGLRKRSKYHHYRPTLHLRHFADARKRVWVYDRQGAFEPCQQRITELRGENYLYAPEIGPDPRDDAWEQWLAREVDAPAAGPLRKALRNENLSGPERSALSGFIAAQDLRTPRARATVLQLFQAGIDDWYTGLASDLSRLRSEILETTGTEYSDEELQLYLETYTPQVTKPSWLDFMGGNLNRAGERIYYMGWRVVVAPPKFEFLTNDVGIVKFFGTFSQPVSYVLGWAAGRDHWLVPLSAQIALALAPADRGPPRQGKPEWIQRVNRQIVKDAWRFVYSHAYSSGVQPWLQPGER
jgi:hypothetical protein